MCIIGAGSGAADTRHVAHLPRVMQVGESLSSWRTAWRKEARTTGTTLVMLGANMAVEPVRLVRFSIYLVSYLCAI
jgi:hypothetical protein